MAVVQRWRAHMLRMRARAQLHAAMPGRSTRALGETLTDMGLPQRHFLKRLRTAIVDRLPAAADWGGGQILSNVAGLPAQSSLRRGGLTRAGERFELGDLRFSLGRTIVVIEYDARCVVLGNLVKYWPYLRGELSSSPGRPLVLCHFSDWWSYGSYRDLWAWVAEQACRDPTIRVPFSARQFDHGGKDERSAEASIECCIKWLEEVTAIHTPEVSFA